MHLTFLRPPLQALAPRCAQLQNDPTLSVMLSLFMPELSLQSQAIKLQWNAGRQWGLVDGGWADSGNVGRWLMEGGAV